MAKQSIALLSAPLVNAPNVIRWAIDNYKYGDDAKRKNMVEVVMCWGNEMINELLAHQILDGSVPLTFDDEEGKVRFEVEDEQLTSK